MGIQYRIQNFFNNPFKFKNFSATCPAGHGSLCVENWSLQQQPTDTECWWLLNKTLCGKNKVLSGFRFPLCYEAIKTSYLVIGFQRPVNLRVTSGWLNSVISKCTFQNFPQANLFWSHIYKINRYTNSEQNRHPQTSNTKFQRASPFNTVLGNKACMLRHAGIMDHSAWSSDTRLKNQDHGSWILTSSLWWNKGRKVCSSRS